MTPLRSMPFATLLALAAIAADKAAPLAKRAGEVTADASGKLASKSREWASELRASVATAEHPPETETETETETTPPAPTPGFEPAEGTSETTEPAGQG